MRAWLTAVFRPLRGRDVALHAAAVTFYAGIAVVPVCLLAVWVTGMVAGADRVRRLTGQTIAALPDDIGAPQALSALIDAGLGLTPLLALASLLPATFYGEGLRRAFVSVRGPGEQLIGWRGRILWLPVLAAAPALLLALLLALPVTSGLWARGGWWSVLGVVLSFLAGWLVLTPVVIWAYRYVAPGSPGRLATVLVGSFTAANLSGFLHGFVLFCSLPLDLGVPFGGFTAIGGMVAVGLWLFVFHTIVLAGYAATLSADSYRRRTLADAEPPVDPGQRAGHPPVPPAEQPHGGRDEQRADQGGVHHDRDDHADADQLHHRDAAGREPADHHDQQ